MPSNLFRALFYYFCSGNQEETLMEKKLKVFDKKKETLTHMNTILVLHFGSAMQKVLATRTKIFDFLPNCW